MAQRARAQEGADAGPTFRRARTREQREQRRAEILVTTRDLLTRTRVADVSLNEIARAVGLAKSNVLRYFETREAILLALLDDEYSAWLGDLADALGPQRPSRTPRGTKARTAGAEVVARAVADTVAARPLLCELLASAPGVLERNVSVEVAAAYKLSALAAVDRLLDLVTPHVGPLDDDAATAFVAATQAAITLLWQMSGPSPALDAAYEQHPELLRFRVDLRVAVRELVATTLVGLLHRDVDATP